MKDFFLGVVVGLCFGASFTIFGFIIWGMTL